MIEEFLINYYQAITFSLFFFIFIYFFIFNKQKKQKNSSNGITGTGDSSSICDSSYIDCSGDGGDG